MATPSAATVFKNKGFYDAIHGGETWVALKPVCGLLGEHLQFWKSYRCRFCTIFGIVEAFAIFPHSQESRIVRVWFLLVPDISPEEVN